MSKLIVFTAPSGAGKTTIVRHLIQHLPSLAFSVSATTRAARSHEKDGQDYYFLTEQDFRQKIKKDAFVEWEEVYANQFYGTLKSEVQRLWAEGKHILFDIDVHGAINVKQSYPAETLTIFVKPPSVDVLLDRLTNRSTETAEQLQKRLDKANYELSFESRCDYILLNDQLSVALEEAEQVVRRFLETPEGLINK